MGFRIDGSDYEIPEFDTFTMGEAVILYDHTKLSLDDFVADPDDPREKEAFRKNLLHPGTVFTRMVVAYLRANRGASRSAAEEIINNSNWWESYQDYLKALTAGDADPPAPSGEDSLPEKPSSSNEDSGGTSSDDSEEPGATPQPTGTSE